MESNKGRILVIDDDKEVHHMLSVILTNHGYRVISAEDPIQGFRLASEEQPDLVILDIYMPGMDGLDVLARLRRSQGASRVPVLMLTAADTFKDINLAFDLGAADYLTKPIDFSRLLGKINELLVN